MKQVIYVDVLFCLNMIVSFFLLAATKRILHLKIKSIRVLFGSTLGGAYSLVILLPQQPLAMSIILRIVFLLVLTLTVFGFANAKAFFRCFFMLGAVSLLFAGGVLAVWLLLKPGGLVMKNGALYFDISFLSLVIFASVVYVAAAALSRLLEKSGHESAFCRVQITYGSKTVCVNGVIDTGNTLRDSFTGQEVSVICASAAAALLPAEMAAAAIAPGSSPLPFGMRLIASSTVSGESLMPVFNADAVAVITDGARLELKGAAIAVSACEYFGKNLSVLVNAQFIPKRSEKHDIKNNSKNTQLVVGGKKRERLLHKRASNAAAAAYGSTGKRDHGAD